MSLDQNLFTLNIIPSETEKDAVDLVEPDGTVHYRKRRTPDPTGMNPYTWSLFEPLSDGLLSSVSAPSAQSKTKTVMLHNPDMNIELKYTGTFSFKWCFDYEDHTFEWRREACYMLRKPDPPVQIAVTREPSGRIKTSTVQLLDYNLSRFDINDRKGLEIVMLTSLLTFTDSADEHQARSPIGGQPATPVQRTAGGPPAAPAHRTTNDSFRDDPPPPPVPAKSALDRIVMAQAQQDLASNEVLITDDVDTESYARYGCDLLQDNNLLYIVLRSGGPENVPKVLSVAEEVKRQRHKAGIEETLHLYPSYNEAPAKGPKVIRLDDPSNNASYKPPMNLTIHLSKIPMPELQPKPKPTTRHGNQRHSPPRQAPPPAQPRRTSPARMPDPWAASRDGHASDRGRESRPHGSSRDHDRSRGKSPSPSPAARPPPPPGPGRGQPSSIPLSPQPGRAGKLNKPPAQPQSSGPAVPPPPPPGAGQRPNNTGLFGRISRW